MVVRSQLMKKFMLMHQCNNSTTQIGVVWMKSKRMKGLFSAEFDIVLEAHHSIPLYNFSTPISNKIKGPQ